MTDLYFILIWILGSVINLLIVLKYHKEKEEEKMDIISAIILMPFLMLEKFVEVVFIVTSWVGLVGLGINKIIDKISS